MIFRKRWESGQEVRDLRHVFLRRLFVPESSRPTSRGDSMPRLSANVHPERQHEKAHDGGAWQERISSVNEVIDHTQPVKRRIW